MDGWMGGWVGKEGVYTCSLRCYVALIDSSWSGGGTGCQIGWRMKKAKGLFVYVWVCVNVFPCRLNGFVRVNVLFVFFACRYSATPGS